MLIMCFPAGEVQKHMFCALLRSSILQKAERSYVLILHATVSALCAVQASYSAAQRLLGGFMNSSEGSGSGGGNDNVTKAAGYFSLRRYRTHFNVDTLVFLSH